MFKLNKNTVIRLADNAFIPMDEGNTDYQAYLAWVAEGNTPEPEDQVDPNLETLGAIAALETATMLNRGSRELELRLMEKEAKEMAAALGVTQAQVLAAQPYYGKLKALDDQIKALRSQLQ